MRKVTYLAAVWIRDLSLGRGGYRRISAVHNLGGNLHHARERARAMLPVSWIEATDYNWQRELGHAPFVVLSRRQVQRLPSGRIGREIVGRREYIEPEIRFVPSVGDLGWMP